MVFVASLALTEGPQLASVITKASDGLLETLGTQDGSFPTICSGFWVGFLFVLDDPVFWQSAV